MGESIIKRVWRVLRRKYYTKFNMNYVKESIAKRKGRCRGCGCCSINSPPCIHYDYAAKKCKIWDNMPLGCKLYPFDEADKTMFSKKYCGYYWD